VFSSSAVGRLEFPPLCTRRYDCTVAVARYEDMLRPVADGQPEGFCKLIVETARRQIVGAHVLGEYSAEVIQMVAAKWWCISSVSVSNHISGPVWARCRRIWHSRKLFGVTHRRRLLR
jgi:hypothetical protein